MTTKEDLKKQVKNDRDSIPEHGIKKDGDIDQRTVSPFERGEDESGHGLKANGDTDQRTVSPYERGEDEEGHGIKKDGETDQRTVSPYERASKAPPERTSHP